MKYYLKSLSGYWPVASSLSSNYIEAAQLFIVLLSIPIRKRFFGNEPKRINISYGNIKKHSFFVRDGADISALREIFAEGEYNLDKIDFQPRSIADLGAHIGSFSIFCLAKYPNINIVAYEPDPENFDILAMNLGEFNQVELVNAAVSSQSGAVDFYKSSDSSTKSSIVKVDKLSYKISVPAVSLTSIVDQGVDLVKFDIEGAEFDLFSNISKSDLISVPVYLGEVHFSLTGRDRKDFEKLFPGFGAVWQNNHSSYSVVNLVRQK